MCSGNLAHEKEPARYTNVTDVEIYSAAVLAEKMWNPIIARIKVTRRYATSVPGKWPYRGRLQDASDPLAFHA